MNMPDEFYLILPEPVSRSIALDVLETQPEKSPRTRVMASAISGGLVGLLAGRLLRKSARWEVLFRDGTDQKSLAGGRGSTIPGMLVFSSAAALGQGVLNYREERLSMAMQSGSEKKEPLWRRLANTKYSPMTILSDEEYEKMLLDKLLRVEAEIAIIDDRVKALKGGEGSKKAGVSSRADTNDPES